MNYLDIILLIPILWGAYKGFSKGLIVALASLLALLLGVYGALHFSQFTGYYLQKNWDIDTHYLPIVAFAITFIGIVLAIHFSAKLLDKLAKAIALGWINTIAGVLFGILKSVFILSVIIFLINKIDTHSQMLEQKDKEASFLYHPIEKVAPVIFPSLNEFQKKGTQFLEKNL